MKMAYPKDITGRRFGMLVGVKKTVERYHRSVVWVFQCDCGNLVEKPINSVQESKRQQNCGCLYDISSGTKVCTSCGERIPLSCFSDESRVKNGYVGMCRDCKAKRIETNKV